MTLIDKVARDDNLSPEERVPGHIFQETLWLWLTGKLTNTEADIFGFDSSEKTKLQEFKVSYDAKNNLGKIIYALDVISAVSLLQNKYITKSKFKSIVGIT